VALAVIAHDMSDGLNTILLVTHGEPASRRDLVFLILDALAPVLGGLLALAILPPPLRWQSFSPSRPVSFCSLPLVICYQRLTDDLPV
jgi:hypothetical protein